MRCTATLMDVHVLGSSSDDQREGNSSCFKPLYPTGGQRVPYRTGGGGGKGDTVKTYLSVLKSWVSQYNMLPLSEKWVTAYLNRSVIVLYQVPT